MDVLLSFIAFLQAPLMAITRPGLWLSFIASSHRAIERWTLSSTPSSKALDFAQEAGSLLQKKGFRVAKVDKKKSFIQFYYLTKSAKWVDLVEIRFFDAELSTNGGCVAEVFSGSSGLFPGCVPFAFLINLFFFWVPFLDFGQNLRHIQELREEICHHFGISIQAEVIETGSTPRYRGTRTSRVEEKSD